MFRNLLCLCAFVLLAEEVSAQQIDDYYPYAEWEPRPAMIETDSTLFYRAVQTDDDLYGRIADFNLPQVAVGRRGWRFNGETVAVEGTPVAYRYASALRLLGADEVRSASFAPAGDFVLTPGGLRLFRFEDAEPLRPYAASVRYADRNYRFGARLTARHAWGRGWFGSMALDLRTGRDRLIEGVFTNALTAAFRIEKRFAEDARLALAVVMPPSVRGTRLSSTEEAFMLTGDRLYNPAWGFQDGKVRNSRVRREVVPLVLLSGRMPLSEATALQAAIRMEAGVRKYSSLGWYDARTPMPDNYRNLPSWSGDRAAEEVWRSSDPRYTQIDWDDLIATNSRLGGAAHYALEDRVERITKLRADLTFETRLDERLMLRYGAFYDFASSRNYKEMRDLLGGEYLTDIDHFLVDDDTYGNRLQNDLRNPDRQIREGDRFGYDYAFTTQQAGVRFAADYRSDRLRAAVAAEIGDLSLRRCGHYEKELFPGSGSYGNSRRMHFSPYAVRLSAGWAFTPRSYLGISALAAAMAPAAADLFYQPLYNNRTIDRPTAERHLAAEVVGRLTGPVLQLHLSAFVAVTTDGEESRRYYDDLAGVYCDMAVEGIARRAVGAEAAAEIRLSPSWSLSLAASAGRYTFIRDPRVTVISDVDNAAIDTRAVSRMGDCRVGGMPQYTAVAALRWFGAKGWGARLSAGYAGGRYVEPAFLRRTARVAQQAAVTPEAFTDFTHQERLDDALTLDAALFKSFRFERSQLSVSLMLRNLTDDETFYNGYESQRVRRLSVGDTHQWQPHATRYTATYPRSLYLTVSYKF